MEINNYNYQAFFLDYHEGNLSPEKVAELMVFISVNPHLEEELYAFESIDVSPQLDKTISIQGLKRQSITGSAFDDYCIAHIEGDLDPRSEMIFLKEIENDKAKKATFDLYKKTIIEADVTLSFDNKDALYQKRSELKIVWWHYAAAAVALILLMVFINPFSKEEPKFAEQILPINTESEKDKKESNMAAVNVTEHSSYQNRQETTEQNQKREKLGQTIPEKKEKIHFASLNERSTISAEIERSSEDQFKLKEIPAANSELLAIKIASTKPAPRKEEYLTLKEYAVLALKERLFNKKADEQVDGWDIAEAGIGGLSKVFNSDIDLSRTENESGEEILAFRSDKISFNRKLSK